MAGLLTLILLSRFLAPVEYAAYFAVWASVEIIVLASNLGLMHAAFRYVHAKESISGDTLTVFGPMWLLLILRVITLGIAVALFVALLPTSLFRGIPAEQRHLLLLALAAIAAAEGVARYCEILFESMLLQWRAQITTLLRVLLKPLGILAFLGLGDLDLEKVLWVEIVSCGIGMLLGLAAIAQLAFKSEMRPHQDGHGQPLSASRVLRFVLPAYLTQLLGLVYGPDVLKLILDSGPDAAALAIFGFAFSLAAMIQRYLPVSILGGIFRPLFVASAKRADAEQALSGLVAMITKLNWLVIALPLVALYPVASLLTDAVSKGNYPQAGDTLLILLIGLTLASMHAVLSLYCLARESSGAPLIATLAAVATLPLSVWLARSQGANGLALGWGISEGVWVLVCWGVMSLRRQQRLLLNWPTLLRIPLFAALVMAAAAAVQSVRPDVDWPLAVMAPLLLGVLCVRLHAFDAVEMERLRSVLPTRMAVLFARFSR